MGLAWRASALPLLRVGGWESKIVCMVQAANTNNMAGIPTVCIAKGNAAHQCAFCL